MSNKNNVKTEQKLNKAAVAKLFVNVVEGENVITFKIKESYLVKTKFTNTPVTNDVGEYSFTLSHRLPLNLTPVLAKKVKDILISNLSKKDQVPALIEQFLNRELLKFHKTVQSVYGIDSQFLSTIKDGDLDKEVLTTPSTFVPGK